MKKSNSHKNSTSHFDVTSKKIESQKKCEVISIKTKCKWTANVSFVSYPSEQRDRAYRNWVRLFLKSLRNTNNS